jgi:G3E family GTPase
MSHPMEAIIVIVGFLGAGKTTLLKKITKEYLEQKWNPFIILNDYENATIDAQSFLDFLDAKQINALNGSCICCSGVQELREQVNRISVREKGITLIEANGTTDAVSLMGFLGVGMEPHFLPPVQIAVVDVKNWQKRGQHNELEANQVQVASVVVLNYTDQVDIERVVEVEQDLRNLNSKAIITHFNKLDIKSLPELHPSENQANKMDHHKSHWSSCSVDIPDPISSERLNRIIEKIPSEILRVKGCTRVDQDEYYSHFERVPDGEVYLKSYYGKPVTGPKLLTVGPGSDPEKLLEIVQTV